MRRLFLILFCLLTALPSFGQSTTLSASHIAQDWTGTLLPSGKLCLVALNSLGQPTGFQNNGVQYLPQMACTTVTAGAISDTSVPDVAHSTPDIKYRATIEDATGKTLYTLSQPISITGTTFNLDDWQPTQTAPVTHETVSSGTSAPQGRCGTAPAIYYTHDADYKCFDQVWLEITSSGDGGSAFVGGTLTAPLYLSEEPTSPFEAATKNYVDTSIAAIPAPTSSDIATALTYVPVSPTDMAAAVAALPVLNGDNIAAALGYVPVSPDQLAAAVSSAAAPSFDILGGTYTSAQTLNLSDSTSGAVISYCTNATGNCTPSTLYSTALAIATNETVCSNAAASGGGVISATVCNAYVINTGTPGTPSGTGIDTIIAQSYLTDGSVAYKTCSQYPGAVCNGGVGTNVPSSAPTHTFGLNTPSANTGLSNKVGNFHLETAIPGASGTQFTMALFTTTGGGVGDLPTATNFYVGGWVKVKYAAGPSRIEMDPYIFGEGHDWMFGFQCNSDRNLFQTANQTSSWTYTSAPCGKLYDGSYHHVELTFHRTLPADTSCSSAPCAILDTVSVDGTSYALNVTMPATSSSWVGSGWQFQIDGAPTTASSGTPAVYDLWVDSAQFIAGTAASGGSPGGGGGSTSGTGDLASYNFDGGLTVPSGLTAVGSPVISASQNHTSPNSAHFPSGMNYFTGTVNPVKTIYSRQYIYVAAENNSLTDGFLRYYHGGSEMFVYYIATSGFVSYFDSASGASVTAAASALSTGAWHLIETKTVIDPTAGHVTVKIDGTQTYDSGPINTGTNTIDTTWFGNIGNSAPTGWDTYQDNVDFDDTNWIGPI